MTAASAGSGGRSRPSERATAFAYTTPLELLPGGGASRRPVIVVGAGPTGLTLAIDLAQRGVPSVLLDDNDVVSVGSRAICWAKRTLEIFDRIGIGERVLAHGVTWNVGRLFHGEREVYAFDLLPEPGHKMPAFVNLQQYHVERYLVERARDFPDLIDLRFRNRVVGVANVPDGVSAVVETPDGTYRIEADYLVACDGARSFVREAMGLDFRGRLFEERFLIADVEMKADFPPERWFWFEPPFHAGRSALLHKQPDDIWRIDLQLGWDADPVEECKPENVRRRIERIVDGRPFELDWVSVYTFQCRRLERFVHGRVLFAGDSAHVVSPFGARGGNGAIQDADNLGWKLAAILHGEAGPGLLESYDDERVRAADENIANSARATNFMTPKSPMERTLRDEVLGLAEDIPFARRLVNSGRLSVPCSLERLPLQTPSQDAVLPVGCVLKDAPLFRGGTQSWLLDEIGRDFALLSVGDAPMGEDSGIRQIRISSTDDAALRDAHGFVRERYGDGLTYLVRPDQHVAAAFRNPTRRHVDDAHRRALGHD